jgi:short-subunit dehydrogenase
MSDNTPDSAAEGASERRGTPSGPAPLAVVTGASRGIGLALAKKFAGAGFDLVVNSEDDALAGAAESLRHTGAGVRAVQADLRTQQGVEELYAAVTATGRPVATAALNAGVGQGGSFVDTDLSDDLAVIELNVVSTVRLAKLFLKEMTARDEGRMLITSSIAATSPGPYQPVYNASKSFLQSFAEALQDELKGTGVTVTSVMPGPTETDFFRRAGMTDTRLGRMEKDDPAQVAAQAFDAVMSGRTKLVTGSLMTKAQGVANKVLPDKLKAAGHRKMAEPGSGR